MSGASRWPRPAELLLALQLGLGALLLLVVSGQAHPVIPLLVALLFPLGTWRRRHDLGLLQHALLVALPVGLSAAVWPVSARGGQQFHGSFHAAVAGLLLAALQLHAAPSPARTGWMLGGTGLAVMATAIGMPNYVGAFGVGALQLEGEPLHLAVTAVWGLAALLVLRGELSAPGAPARGALPALVCALLTAALTWGLVRLVRATYDDMSTAYFKLLEGAPLRSAGGFSGQVQLGSLAAQIGPEGQAVALRAFADRPPGYLRGKVFQAYGKGRWTAQVPTRDLPRAQGRVQLPGRPASGAGAAPLEVYPDEEYGANFFLPLEASAVETACERVVLQHGGALRSASQPTSRGYGVHLDPAPVQDGLDEPGWLQLPQDPELLAALDELIAAQRLAGLSPEDAVVRLGRWFSGAYEYRLGIELRPGKDPLVQWLREERHGHCELFASAGALVLRRLGVPCRYVTGFLCEEGHPWEDGVWVARRAHAHAWIEWIDGARGWRVAELTPPGAIAPVAPPGGLAPLTEWLSARWDRLAGALRGGLSSLPGLLFGLARDFGAWVIAAWWRLPVLLLLLAAWPLLQRWRKRGVAGPTRRVETPLRPEVEAARRRFQRLEARLRRVGLGRAEHDTLLEYAARLERAELPGDVARDEALGLVRGLALERYAP